MKSEISLQEVSDRDVYLLSEKKFLLLIPKSRSKNYALAISLSKKLENTQVSIDTQIFNICFIDLENLRECEIANQIIDIARLWKGFSCIYRGRTLNIHHLGSHVFQCIIEANQCKNKKAHCSKVMHGNSYIKHNTYPGYQICNFELIVPCKIASFGFYEPSLDISVNDQYQAYAVSTGTNWCPFFDENAIEILDI